MDTRDDWQERFYREAVEDRAAEEMAWKTFEGFLTSNRKMLSRIAGSGDGRCGAMIEMMQKVLLPPPAPRIPSPPHVTPGTKRAVMERDGYRCQACGGHTDLRVFKMSASGGVAPGNLRTGCAACGPRVFRLQQGAPA